MTRHAPGGTVSLLTLCLALAAGLVVAAPVGAQSGNLQQLDGSGTAEDPYVVTDSEGLQAIEENLEAHYVLGNDIDASGSTDWNAGSGLEPIGGPDNPFAGILDGQNHTIEGLTVRYPSREGVGLIGALEGTLRDIHLAEVSIEGEHSTGAAVGRNYGEIVGVSATADVTAHDDNSGGLVGWNREGGQVTASWVDASVSGNDNQVGGLVGMNHGEITDAYSLGDVTGRYVGGFAGGNHNSIQHIYTTAEVASTEDSTYAAGITYFNNLLANAYWNSETSGQADPVAKDNVQGTGLRTAEMTGPATTSSMSSLLSRDTWITTDSYPLQQRDVRGLSLQTDDVLIAGNESDVEAWLALVGDRTGGVVTVATFESSNTDVATVEDGVVTGHAPGQATITASHAGERATADVVVIADEGISSTATELDSGNVTTGETATVTGTLRNVDENATYRDVSLQVDGESVTTANVTVDGDAEATHTFEWTPESAGSYDLTVDGIDAGTLHVTDPAAEGSDGGSSGGSGAGDSGSSGGSTDGGSGDLPVTLAVGTVIATAVVGLLARRGR